MSLEDDLRLDEIDLETVQSGDIEEIKKMLEESNIIGKKDETGKIKYEKRVQNNDLLEESNNIFKSINEDKLDELKNEMLQRVNTPREIFIVGNGGSAANANHIAGDYLKTFSSAGFNFKINSLSGSTSYLTAASNDIDFTAVYEILINTRICKGDLLIFLVNI